MASQRPLFHDTDSDSIATDSTAESTLSREEYDVEKVLLEVPGDEGQMYYLLKWVGYPLHEATYEPVEHIRVPSILEEWEQTKRRVVNGEEAPFDPEDFLGAVEAAQAKKEDRKRRRKAKRRRLGIPALASKDERANVALPQSNDRLEVDSSSDDMPLRLKRPAAASTSKRKGIATAVKRKPALGEASRVRASTKSGGPQTPASAMGSLSQAKGDLKKARVHTTGLIKADRLTTGLTKTVKSTSHLAKTAPPSAVGNAAAAPTQFNTMAVKSTAPPPTRVEEASESTNKSLPTEAPTETTATSSAPATPASSKAASVKPTPAHPVLSTSTSAKPAAVKSLSASKISAPAPNPVSSLKKRQSTGSVFAKWDQPAGKRMRAQVNGDTPKDSQEGLFTKLSVQNRYQKYGVNEAPPNIDQLTIVDPISGTTIPPKPQPAKPQPNQQQLAPKQPSGKILEAYGRRSPPAERPRSICPESQARSPMKAANVVSYPDSATASANQRICAAWLSGGCSLGERCQKLHSYELPPPITEHTVPFVGGRVTGPNGHLPSKEITCHFWQHNPRGCRYSEEQCAFAHYDTKIYRTPPERTLRGERTNPRTAAGSQTSTAAFPLQHQQAPARTFTQTSVPVHEPLAVIAQSSASAPLFENSQASFPLRDSSSAQQSQPSPEVLRDALALASLDAVRILSISHGKPKFNNVFVMTPPDCQKQLSALVYYFQNLGCNVHSPRDPGGWEVFEEAYRKYSVLILHSDIMVWKVANLQRFLSGGAKVRVFLVNLDTPLAYTATQLFPYGEVVLITDDVFVDQPERAISIIERVEKAERAKPAGARNSKIATRPGVKEWLWQLASERSLEGRNTEQDGSRWTNLYLAICKLCPDDEKDPWDPPNPRPSSLLESVPTSHLPSYETKWEDNPEVATDYLVNWYAGWGVANAGNYGRFIVCHEAKMGGKRSFDENRRHEPGEADPRHWAEEYQHLAVMTPNDWLTRHKAMRK